MFTSKHAKQCFGASLKIHLPGTYYFKQGGDTSRSFLCTRNFEEEISLKSLLIDFITLKYGNIKAQFLNLRLQGLFPRGHFRTKNTNLIQNVGENVNKYQEGSVRI